MEDERRRTPRFPFIATAEVIEKGASAGMAARVTELSLYGCYVEMANPLAKGWRSSSKSTPQEGISNPKAPCSILSRAKAWELAFKM